MRAVGYAVESICAVLREQGVQVAARTYRAWKKRLLALRTIDPPHHRRAPGLESPRCEGTRLARDHLREADNDAVAAP